ncbi:hypothetical protein VTH06DRAFT_5951 [Thermothelomyces fergusii]
MPCLRGVELLLTTLPSSEPIPEYPHPDGASARLFGTLLSCPNGLTSQRKTGPTVAVYIPSVPDYSINTVPSAPCKYVFFRLCINGRHIAAWGTDPAVRPKGKVTKSLWAPSELCHDQAGIEGRSFVFLPGQEHKSVAEDGGLIEIQVFRARDRRVRAPRLEKFRYRESYGIGIPSVGLVDQPQDACFYDWHLLDPRDSPFATFRFHYRSLSNLRQLNLIPETEFELFFPGSLKNPGALSKAVEDGELPEDALDGWSFGSEDTDEAVFHDRSRRAPLLGNVASAGYHLKSPPELFPVTSSNGKVPQPSKALRDASLEPYLQRPLPQLPSEEPNKCSRRSSAASATSATPSITPSLLRYLEEDSLNPEEAEIGVAKIVQLASSQSATDVVEDENSGSLNYSVSDYETSPESQSDSSLVEERMSPACYLPTTGSGLERGIALFTPPKRTAISGESQRERFLPSGSPSHRHISCFKTTALDEPGRRAVKRSPNRAEHANVVPRPKFSPRPGKEHGKSLIAGLRKKKSIGSPSKSGFV